MIMMLLDLSVLCSKSRVDWLNTLKSSYRILLQHNCNNRDAVRQSYFSKKGYSDNKSAILPSQPVPKAARVFR
jgi:hypothetical protein